MPLHTSPGVRPRYHNSLERRPDPKDLIERDPLLIPQLFVDPTPPWHTRKRWRFALVVVVGVVSVIGTLVVREGPSGAAAALGEAGVGVLRFYTRLVTGGPG